MMPAAIRAMPAGNEKPLLCWGTVVIAKGNLAQKQAKAGDHKTESHECDAGSYPGEESALGSHINARVVG
jgi:hypothetical protein